MCVCLVFCLFAGLWHLTPPLYSVLCPSLHCTICVCVFSVLLIDRFVAPTPPLFSFLCPFFHCTIFVCLFSVLPIHMFFASNSSSFFSSLLLSSFLLIIF